MFLNSYYFCSPGGSPELVESETTFTASLLLTPLSQRQRITDALRCGTRLARPIDGLSLTVSSLGEEHVGTVGYD